MSHTIRIGQAAILVQTALQINFMYSANNCVVFVQMHIFLHNIDW